MLSLADSCNSSSGICYGTLLYSGKHDSYHIPLKSTTNYPGHYIPGNKTYCDRKLIVTQKPVLLITKCKTSGALPTHVITV